MVRIFQVPRTPAFHSKSQSLNKPCYSLIRTTSPQIPSHNLSFTCTKRQAEALSRACRRNEQNTAAFPRIAWMPATRWMTPKAMSSWPINMVLCQWVVVMSPDDWVRFISY
eukprot:sb/3477164/